MNNTERIQNYLKANIYPATKNHKGLDIIPGTIYNRLKSNEYVDGEYQEMMEEMEKQGYELIETPLCHFDVFVISEASPIFKSFKNDNNN
jgi:hypothetical protein